MNYKVLKRFRGSPNGYEVNTYEKGKILTEDKDFPMSLIEVAMAEGWVKPTRSKPEKPQGKK